MVGNNRVVLLGENYANKPIRGMSALASHGVSGCMGQRRVTNKYGWTVLDESAASLLREATKRISNAFQDSAREIKGFVDDAGWQAGRSSAWLGGADTDGAGVLRRAWTAPPSGTVNETLTERTLSEGSGDVPIPLYGLDRNDRYTEFDFEQVRSVPLKSHDGKLIGVSFPSRHGDVVRIQAWARSRHTSGNQEYYPRWAVSDVATHKRRGTPWSKSSPEPAPWYDTETGLEPIVLNAHANGTGYSIKVKDLSTGSYDRVKVDGIVFGRLAEQSHYFQRACQEYPGSPLLQVSCSPASEDGDAHRLLSGHLHRNGFTSDVWAARDIMFTSRDGKVGALVSIDPDGFMIPPFTVARAPRPSPDS